jgi:hypothetical protein
LKVPLHYFPKDKKSNRSHKTVGIKVFYYFCSMIEGSGFGSIPLTNGSGIQQAKKHTDPTDPDSDPDPQPWFYCNLILEIPQRTGTLNYMEVAEMNSQADIGLPKTEPGLLNF